MFRSITATATDGEYRNGSARPFPAIPARMIIGLLFLSASVFAILYGADGLPMEGRISLAAFAGALIAWVVLDLPDLPVALAAALVLVLSGTVAEETLFATLGNEIIWLLIAAFMLASVLRDSGIAERLAAAVLARFRTVSGLFWGVTVVTGSTAFLIPSTSARAAILLPLFIGLADAVGRPAVTRGLALLFPSVILLSACASMTGAGAHLIAADFMKRMGGGEIGFAHWALLGTPFALATSLIACGLIQFLFLSPEDRRTAVGSLPVTSGKSSNGVLVLLILAATVVLWATSALHGQNIAVIALLAALLAASRPVSGTSFKRALKGVEWNLLLFMAATLLLGEALLSSGAASYLVDGMLAVLGGDMAPGKWAVVAVVALVSSLAHLVITSRTARAGVLIPAVALPLAAFGVDPSALIFITAVGTGFCQTLTVSAKPVLLFGSAGSMTFTQADLFRLAAFLLPLFVGLLIVFALFVWPLLGLSLETTPAPRLNG